MTEGMSMVTDLIRAAIALDDAVAPYMPEAFPADVLPALRELRKAVGAYDQRKFWAATSASDRAAIRLRELLSQQISQLDGPQMDRWIGAVLELQRLCRKGDK